jgi:hypothetical protein
MVEYRTDRPAETEYAPFYAGYIAETPGGDILAILRGQVDEFRATLDAVPAGGGESRYAPGKWSIKEVAGHIIDAERLFGYRAFRFARNDSTPLSGFDEDYYVDHGWFDACPLERLEEEFRLVRLSHLAMFASFPPEAWTRGGIANGNHVSVRALAYIMAGHAAHHLEVLRTRYL